LIWAGLGLLLFVEAGALRVLYDSAELRQVDAAWHA